MENNNTRSKAFANEFGKFVNVCGTNYQETAKCMCNEHRYLQNEMFKVCMAFISRLSEKYDNGEYDARNEYACKTSKEIIDHFKKIDYPY